jgi:acyl-CoA synthetase (AMP-forming)/AMP-acid ligase II
MITADLKTFNDIYNRYAAESDRNRIALIADDTSVSVGELLASSDSFAEQCTALGIKTGTRVGYTLPNCAEVFSLVTALARLGALMVPLFPMIPDMGKATMFKNAGCEYVVTSPPQAGPFKEAAQRIGASFKLITIGPNSAGDPVLDANSGGAKTPLHVLPSTPADLPILMSSSSGTTGVPKLVLMTQSNAAALLHAAIEMVSPVDDSNGKGFSSIMAFPLSTAGVLNCIGTLFAGVTLIFTADVSPVKFMQLLVQHKADSISAPPAYLEAILSLPHIDTFDRSSVKKVFTGMDFFSPSLLARLAEKFTNIDGAANGYGLIETTNVIMISKASKATLLSTPLNLMTLAKNAGNAIEVRDENGTPLPVGSEGELCVKGPSVVRGYINNPEESAKAFIGGWFKTGDVVRLENDSTVTLLGRKKYLIKRGGKSVSPIQVQDCINKLASVKSSAVIGVPHHLYGEMIWAFIVGKKGAGIELKDVMKHTRAELPNYMVPDQVSFIEEIPKNPGAGKVNVQALVEMAQKELANTNGGTNV